MPLALPLRGALTNNVAVQEAVASLVSLSYLCHVAEYNETSHSYRHSYCLRSIFLLAVFCFNDTCMEIHWLILTPGRSAVTHLSILILSICRWRKEREIDVQTYPCVEISLYVFPLFSTSGCKLASIMYITDHSAFNSSSIQPNIPSQRVYMEEKSSRNPRISAGEPRSLGGGGGRFSPFPARFQLDCT